MKLAGIILFKTINGAFEYLKLKDLTKYEIQYSLQQALDILVDSRKILVPKVKKSIEVSTENQSIQSNITSLKKTDSDTSEKKKKIDVSSILTWTASFVAILATISTILLSWRKDIREARAELRRLEASEPRIHVP